MVILITVTINIFPLIVTVRDHINKSNKYNHKDGKKLYYYRMKSIKVLSRYSH